MTGVSPLGRFAAPASAFACLLVVAAAVLNRLLHPGQGDSFLEMLAVLGFGVLIGQPLGMAQGRAQGEAEAAAKINGLATQVQAANLRLDATGAPSATVAAAQLGVPAPPPADGH